MLFSSLFFKKRERKERKGKEKKKGKEKRKKKIPSLLSSHGLSNNHK